MVARSSSFPIKNCDIHPDAAIATSKLATGALAAGTTLPATQVTAGALPAGVTLPATQVSAGALPTGVSLTDEVSLAQLPNLARVVGVGTTPAKSATAVAGSLAGNSATHDFTIETEPIDVPRNVEVVFAAEWDGGDVTVTGTDQYGGAQDETFTGASDVTRVGAKVFATVTAAVKTAVGENVAGATIGTGAKIGIGVNLSDSSGVCFTSSAFDGACVFDATNDAFTPSVEPNDDTYTLIVNV